MLFLIAAAASFASSPSCTETVCPKPDCDCPKPDCDCPKTDCPKPDCDCPKPDCPKPDHDGFLRPGCSSKIAANKTSTPMAGGTLYVHDSAAGAWEWSQIVDLGDAAVAAGCVPRHMPHMVLPSPNQAYVAVTYTGDKHVHILDASTKRVVVCLDASHPAAGVVGGAMHAGAWDGDDHFIIVDMTGSVNGVTGGALHKFQIDLANGVGYHMASLAMGPSASARGTTATKPIAMGTNTLGAYGHLFVVTDAKGAGSIINATSMTVARDLPLTDFGDCKGGGLWTVAHPEDPEVLIAQYGSQNGSECLYQINLKSLAITKVYALPTAADDAHGIAFCKASSGDHYLVNTNRASATLDVLNYATGAIVVDSFDLNGPLAASPDLKVLQPDVIYLHQDEGGNAADSVLYMGGRGLEELPDALPGLFKLHLTDCVAPAYHATERNLQTEQARVPAIKSDVHSVWLVGTEVWAIDQAATGSVQTYEVFSKCAAY